MKRSNEPTPARELLNAALFVLGIVVGLVGADRDPSAVPSRLGVRRGVTRDKRDA